MQPAEEKQQPIPTEEAPEASPRTEAALVPEGAGEQGPAAESTPPAGEPKQNAGKSSLRETLETVLIALLLALVIRSFLVQQYVVDGQSMFPTLHHGDRLLVNKLIYRLTDPKPGEIVVLEDPANPRRQLIKRVIAVGGETIEVRNQVVFINGKALKEEFTNPVTPRASDQRPLQVPEGYVFVMGDNRGESLDSRMLGPIQLQRLEGKALFLFWPAPRFNQVPLHAERRYIESGGLK